MLATTTTTRGGYAPSGVAASFGAPASASAAAAASGTTFLTSRLATRANVTASCFLPKHAMRASSFGGLLGGGTGGGAASSHGSSLLESSLSVAYGLAGGSSGTSELVVRSLLTPDQVAQLRQQQAAEMEESDDASLLAAIDSAPILARVQMKGAGDIRAVECLSDRLLIAATENGDVTMVEIGQTDSHGNSGSSFGRSRGAAASLVASSASLALRPVHTFSGLHAAPCSGLAVHLASSTPLVASCGEDGSFALLAPLTRTVVRRVERAHPSALSAITFASSSTLFTGGHGGNISGWDVRALSDASSCTAKPASLLCDPNAVAVTSLAMHPTRSHILAAGTSNGSLSIFDLRSSGRPLCSIQSQRSCVSSLAFLPWAPSTLAAASEDGSLCTFDFSVDATDLLGAQDVTFSESEAANQMRPTKAYQHTAPLNSLAVDRASRQLLAGADGHACILVQHTA